MTASAAHVQVQGQERQTYREALFRVMSRYMSDGIVDPTERERLHRLFDFLDGLGWAPGE